MLLPWAGNNYPDEVENHRNPKSFGCFYDKIEFRSAVGEEGGELRIDGSRSGTSDYWNMHQTVNAIQGGFRRRKKVEAFSRRNLREVHNSREKSSSCTGSSSKVCCRKRDDIHAREAQTKAEKGEICRRRHARDGKANVGRETTAAVNRKSITK